MYLLRWEILQKDRERPLVGRGEVVRKRPVFDTLGTTLIRQMDIRLDLKVNGLLAYGEYAKLWNQKRNRENKEMRASAPLHLRLRSI